MIKVDNIRVLDAIWFDNYGIIKCIDDITNEIKFYMGVGDGLDEAEDTKKIIQFGKKNTKEQMNDLINTFFGGKTGKCE